MKKISFIIILCMIFTCVHNQVFAEDTYVPFLRVGLSYGSSAKSEAVFRAEAPIDIVDGTSLSYLTTIPAGTELRLTAEEDEITGEYLSPNLSVIRLDCTSVMSYNGSQYRGSFELRANDNKITVINIVGTEEYLTSVLGREMSPSWPIEALKAQAVCARNYAITNLNKHASYGFNICASTDCQVYAGVAGESERTALAVKETEGVLVTYKGKVVPLFYFSCDGGYTENSENVWIAAEGYLRGKQDIYENPKFASHYNWSKTYTKKEIEEILQKNGMNIGELLDIRIDEVSENNGVVKLTFVGYDGEKSITKTQTRTVLSLNSQAYTIEKVREADKPENVAKHVLTNSGVTLAVNPMYALTALGIGPIHYAQELPEENAESYDSYVFNGHGWGHLVGMSQWGAYSMAYKGMSYEEILNFYYTDIVIEKDGESTEAETDQNDEIQRNDFGI